MQFAFGWGVGFESIPNDDVDSVDLSADFGAASYDSSMLPSELAVSG